MTDSTKDRLQGLDGLRFVAAGGVVLYHFTARWSQAWGRAPEEVFPELGAVAVYAVAGPEQFFVISGFVILMTAWGRSVPQVAASRLARLYPAYWVAVVLTSVLLLVIWPGGKRISLGEAAVNLTMLQAVFGVRHVDGVYWTLWTELRFYLLVIVFVLVGITRRRVLAVCALWPPVAVLAARADLGPFATALLGGYAPLFAGGMALYVIHRFGHATVPWLLVGGNAALAVQQLVPKLEASIVRNTGFDPRTGVLTLVLLGCFASVAVLGVTPLRYRGGRWLVVLGALTYPLYLVHEFWGWWFISLAHPSLGPRPTLAVAVVLVVGMAAAIHYGVERPLGPRLRRRLEEVLDLRAPRDGWRFDTRRERVTVVGRPDDAPEAGPGSEPGPDCPPPGADLRSST